MEECLELTVSMCLFQDPAATAIEYRAEGRVVFHACWLVRGSSSSAFRVEFPQIAWMACRLGDVTTEQL